MNKKVLILGSAPSLNLLTEEKKTSIKLTYNEIFCINNAWSCLRNKSKVWCHSTDFNVLGTLFPSDEDRVFIKEEIVKFNHNILNYDKSNLGSGTMFLNTLYHVFNTYINDSLEIHVLGCDFDYSNKEQTHFYGKGKVNEETKKLLELNANEFKDIAADPFRYGVDNLKRELDKTLDIPNVVIYTLSPNKNQLLPYPYFEGFI